MSQSPSIIYTVTDEAPALATRSLLPVISAFVAPAGIGVETRDISLAARILATFPERLSPEKRIDDDLAELGAMARTPEANIIKLPNISASVPQLTAAISELRAQGFDLPDYPEDPTTGDEREVKARYDKIKGSAVNPVLREGNSDRRAPKAVKEYARRNPPPMKPWESDSPAHVASMNGGDFFGNEKSVTVAAATTARIEHLARDGKVTVMKDGLALQAGEVLDATFMSRKALVAFLAREIEDARDTGVLFSLHLKATMMKVSDPIIFGHAVRVFFADVFEKHGAALEEAGAEANNGLGDVISKLDRLPANQRAEIEAGIAAALAEGPAVAMVDSSKGITNLHVPSDIIIDASMPPLVRDGGCMWNAAGRLQAAKAVIPDRSYSTMYQAVIDFCKKNGAFDPTTMGSVSNVGLMAQKAEEYGSHDKTFEVTSDGAMRIVDAAGDVLIEHDVEKGDIWRACQVKDAPIRDWVKLGVGRARATGTPAVFWLDRDRAHDAQVIAKVEAYLTEHDIAGLDIRILAPADACTFSLERIKKGEDTISVTGNVLRDYLTDLFPILELGTSAKMLSIVPLMNGGGLFETGAGGSAPKHVEQFVREAHLRWDSLGEFLALTVSLEHVADRHDHGGARVLSETLDRAVARLLIENKSPKRGVGELDNRGSHYFLARYWAEELARQDGDAVLRERFEVVATNLAESQDAILGEIDATQGSPVDLKGYYRPDDDTADAAMRPSATFNAIIGSV